MRTALLGTGGELDATLSKRPGHRLTRLCPHSAHLPPSTHTCMIRTLQEGTLSQIQGTLTTCSPQRPRAPALPPLGGRDYWGKSRGGKKRLCLVLSQPWQGLPHFQ